MDEDTNRYINNEFVHLNESLRLLNAALERQDTRLRNIETTAANYYGRLWAFGVTITGMVTVISVALNFLMR